MSDGVEIIFRASYAADVEKGHPARPWTTGKRGASIKVKVKQHKVKPYTRKDGTVVSGHTVAAHTKEYKNVRLIGWNPKIPGTKQREKNKIWRVFSQEPAQDGQFFLTRAVRDTIIELPNDIEFYLSQIESNGRATYYYH